MHEMSAFSIMDLIKQRSRWLKGYLLVIHSKEIPLKSKIFLAMNIYAWICLPFTMLSAILIDFYEIPLPLFLRYLRCFLTGTYSYMYIFGAIKSFSHRDLRIRIMIVAAIGLFIAPINLFIDSFVVLFSIFKNKYEFYVIKKEDQIVKFDHTIV